MMEPENKVLILAYDFPPYNSVGGLRPYSWFTHLGQNGVYPIIVTRQWSNDLGNELDYISPSKERVTVIEETEKGMIIRTPYQPNLANKILLKFGSNRLVWLRRGVSAFFEFGQYLLPIGPKRKLYSEAKNYLKSHNVDCILATGEPFVLFKYANKLSKRYRIPWVADYRDPWSQSDRRSNGVILKAWNKYFESKYLASCSQIVTVSEEFKKLIAQLAKGTEISVIPNGFDEVEGLEMSEMKQKGGHLTIAFVGSIYPWYPLEEVLSILFSFDQIHLTFIGISNEEKLKELMANNFSSYKDRVTWLPKLATMELRKELSKANLMLLFNDFGHIGSKIYTYVAVKRKVIFCFSNDKINNRLRNDFYPYEMDVQSPNLQMELIQKTNCGIIVENQAHLKVVLQDQIEEMNQSGFIECNSKNIEEYSRSKGVQKMADILKSI